jgi:hypothetical protein
MDGPPGPAGAPGVAGPPGPQGIVASLTGTTVGGTISTGTAIEMVLTPYTFTVNPGDKVLVTWDASVTLGTTTEGVACAAGQCTGFYAGFHSCYKASGGTPTLGPLSVIQQTNITKSDRQRFAGSYIFTFGAAGTYAFGACARRWVSGTTYVDFFAGYGAASAIAFR